MRMISAGWTCVWSASLGTRCVSILTCGGLSKLTGEMRETDVKIWKVWHDFSHDKKTVFRNSNSDFMSCNPLQSQDSWQPLAARQAWPSSIFCAHHNSMITHAAKILSKLAFWWCVLLQDWLPCRLLTLMASQWAHCRGSAKASQSAFQLHLLPRFTDRGERGRKISIIQQKMCLVSPAWNFTDTLHSLWLTSRDHQYLSG